MGKSKSQSRNAILLPGILNLGVAEQLREQFVDYAARENNLIVDASEVETITTPCIQVLVAAGRALEENGGTLKLTNPSPSVSAAFQDLGLGVIFEKWSN